MIRTAVISVTASFVLVGAWAVNLVSYHPAPNLDSARPAQRSCGLEVDAVELPTVIDFGEIAARRSLYFLRSTSPLLAIAHIGLCAAYVCFRG